MVHVDTSIHSLDAVYVGTGYQAEKGPTLLSGPYGNFRLLISGRGKNHRAPIHVLDRLQPRNLHYARATARAGVPTAPPLDAPVIPGCRHT